MMDTTQIELMIEDGDVSAARDAALALARVRPGLAQAHFLAGRALLLAGEVELASAAQLRAVQSDPAHAGAHLELGRIHARQREFDDALDEFTLVLHYAPQSAQAYYEIGKLHWMRGMEDPAIEHLLRAIELDPKLVAAHAELGFIYGRRSQFGAAIEVLERAIALNPRDINVLNRLGYALVRTEQYERGREFFARVCEDTPPAFLGPRLNLANAYFHLGNFPAARRIYEEILARSPQHFETRWNRAHLMLGDRQFEAGWQEYENRWMVGSVWMPRLIPYSPWTGQALEGKTLLVSSEQGLGDEIMFSSCIADVVRRARRVILECEPRLEGLLRRSFPEADVVSSGRGPKLPGLERADEIDYHVPLGSLPLHFRRREEDFPRHAGYLKADPERISGWRRRLAGLGPGLKVGLSWRGGTPDTRRTMRSVALEQLLPLLRRQGTRFVSLQYGNCGPELEALKSAHGIEVAHWQEAIDDYEETAALCCALDLTLSVCTAVIHLIGALGRPVWVMVPEVPEWRYGFRGADMPWYPSARLFRQQRKGDWTPVVREIIDTIGDGD